MVKLITIAPEAFDSTDFITEASKNVLFPSDIPPQIQMRHKTQLISVFAMLRIFIMQ